MIEVKDVAGYIDSNILHSEQWDAADETRRKKAVNNAQTVLLSVLSDKYSSMADLSLDDIAFQAVWMLKIDDSFQRAEMGVQQMTVDGVTILFRNKDNTLAPAVANKYGVSLVNGQRRRTGSYRVPINSTYRIPVDNSYKLADRRK